MVFSLSGSSPSEKPSAVGIPRNHYEQVDGRWSVWPAGRWSCCRQCKCDGRHQPKTSRPAGSLQLLLEHNTGLFKTQGRYCGVRMREVIGRATNLSNTSARMATKRDGRVCSRFFSEVYWFIFQRTSSQAGGGGSWVPLRNRWWWLKPPKLNFHRVKSKNVSGVRSLSQQCC